MESLAAWLQAQRASYYQVAAAHARQAAQELQEAREAQEEAAAAAAAATAARKVHTSALLLHHSPLSQSCCAARNANQVLLVHSRTIKGPWCCGFKKPAQGFATRWRKELSQL